MRALPLSEIGGRQVVGRKHDATAAVGDDERAAAIPINHARAVSDILKCAADALIRGDNREGVTGSRDVTMKNSGCECSDQSDAAAVPAVVGIFQLAKVGSRGV